MGSLDIINLLILIWKWIGVCFFVGFIIFGHTKAMDHKQSIYIAELLCTYIMIGTILHIIQFYTITQFQAFYNWTFYKIGTQTIILFNKFIDYYLVDNHIFIYLSILFIIFSITQYYWFKK